ncbi:MAG: sterol desaturase [Flavobacteriaceae bacterium CG_4_10_14_0_8_um_filter_31_99]|nr:MAG: sterol desaturase [Flavobacteriaceae bacterium CG2_30_31_66]PIV97891.1 MAG: sterol desaturase [Flavobacteriaceae bacterium CG17_big_fil_post_rev_8_21_14_2_50_31_13]PIX12728.1 MAG: sterol desaturase [Flavobacteriaceae bacterium CG_4_8_14_3_um_filter_31_8]PIZ10900.1 MAG: sterol desaturase [Flavobacteriaceae bacterium CG_4_10_14_0_8_um_filter_31_99]
MEKYLEIIKNSYTGYWNYIQKSVLMELNWENYFYGLILISLLVWGLEIVFPWRKNQPIIRKDFWLDTFYMFFNFFLLNLIVLIALSNTAALFFNDILGIINLSIADFQLFDINTFPYWARLLVFFVIIDFVQWFTHTLLHKYEFLWNFHKVHHSVKQMGFAAHLRYHWMEPVLYNSMKYIPLAIMGGFTAQDVAIVHFFNIAIGHLNHANINWDYGYLKYVLNNPKMHIWHHAKELPEGRKNGVNFGISLSIWDYIFKTNYIPHSGRDIELGFEGDEQFPKGFIKQELYPLVKK